MLSHARALPLQKVRLQALTLPSFPLFGPLFSPTNRMADDRSATVAAGKAALERFKKKSKAKVVVAEAHAAPPEPVR